MLAHGLTRTFVASNVNLRRNQKTIFVGTNAHLTPIVTILHAITAKSLIGVKMWLAGVIMVQRLSWRVLFLKLCNEFYYLLYI